MNSLRIFVDRVFSVSTLVISFHCFRDLFLLTGSQLLILMLSLLFNVSLFSSQFNIFFSISLVRTNFPMMSWSLSCGFLWNLWKSFDITSSNNFLTHSHSLLRFQCQQYLVNPTSKQSQGQFLLIMFLWPWVTFSCFFAWLIFNIFQTL